MIGSLTTSDFKKYPLWTFEATKNPKNENYIVTDTV